jgi:hypothetical protein
VSARALEQAIEHPDVDMVAVLAGKDIVGVVEDTGEKQRHSHAAGKAPQNTAAAGDSHP